SVAAHRRRARSFSSGSITTYLLRRAFKSATSPLDLPFVVAQVFYPNFVNLFSRDALHGHHGPIKPAESSPGTGRISARGNSSDSANVIRSNAKVVHGTPGDDIIIGGSANQKIYGGGGTDIIIGGGGGDRIRGGNGGDRIFGGNGGDRIRGGNGDDRIRG